MKTIAVIPIKLKNERLPNKNIKLLSNGKPLCWYIFNVITKVNNIDEIYVYCSDEEIQKYLPKEIKFLKRSKELDKNTTTMNEILKEFSQEIKADLYVLTHITAPFIEATTFETCINKVKNEGYDSAFSVKKVQDFLWRDGNPINYDLDNIPRTQDLPDIFKETCGLYVFKKELIEKFNRRIGNKAYLCEVTDIEAIDINNEFDFIIADCIADRYKEI